MTAYMGNEVSLDRSQYHTILGTEGKLGDNLQYRRVERWLLSCDVNSLLNLQNLVYERVDIITISQKEGIDHLLRTKTHDAQVTHSSMEHPKETNKTVRLIGQSEAEAVARSWGQASKLRVLYHNPYIPTQFCVERECHPMIVGGVYYLE